MRPIALGWGSLLCLVVLSQGLSAKAVLPERVTVRLWEAVGPVRQVTLHGPVKLAAPINRRLPAGRYQLKAEPHGIALLRETQRLVSAPILTLQPSDGQGIHLSGARDRRYSGQLTVRWVGGSRPALSMSNALPAKDYVQSVVGSESPPGWPLEALKAQAVLTQTRLHQLTPNTFLSDTTQSESYQGLDVIRPAVREAVQAVWGQQLTYQGRPIQVYYHAACGGHTSPLGYIASYQQPSRPPVTPPYLRGVACQACRTSPFGQPKTVSIPKAAWTTRWGSAPISLSQLDPAGRPMTVTLGDGHTMSGYRFWILTGQRLGWDKLPGTRFTLLSSSDDTLSFQSVGSGHGVGLCQWGAASKARAGQTYRDILRAYFPGTHLTPR